jgi:hypothetical protein
MAPGYRVMIMVEYRNSDQLKEAVAYPQRTVSSECRVSKVACGAVWTLV